MHVPAIDRPVPAALRANLITLAAVCLIALFLSSASAVSAQTLSVGVYPSGASVASLQEFEELSGRHQDYFMYYENWDFGANPQLLSAIASRGSIPIVTWEPFGRTLSDIAGGAHDQYVREYARSLKSVGHTVLLRPMHEMNGNWYPWGVDAPGNTPALYRDAFRRIVDIFRAEGAANVRFVFSPNNAGPPSWNASSIPSFFPGDAYVDYTAIDAYNFGTSASGFKWLSFGAIFSDAYQTLATMSSRPIMIGETASTEIGGDKAAWIHQMFYTVKTAYPRIQTITWFQEAKETDWRINSSGTALDAYRLEMQRLDSPPPPVAISDTTAEAPEVDPGSAGGGGSSGSPVDSGAAGGSTGNEASSEGDGAGSGGKDVAPSGASGDDAHASEGADGPGVTMAGNTAKGASASSSSMNSDSSASSVFGPDAIEVAATAMGILRPSSEGVRSSMSAASTNPLLASRQISAFRDAVGDRISSDRP